MKLEAPKLNTMSSGELSLALTEQVAADDFAAYANQLLRTLNGTVESKAASADELLWDVTIDGVVLWLAWDIWSGISLDSKDPAGSAVVRSVHERLLKQPR